MKARIMGDRNRLSLPYKNSVRPVNIVIGLLLFLATSFTLAWPHLPVADATEYFKFSDVRTLLGIPNAIDVISNLAFLFVGLYGIKTLTQNKMKWSHPLYLIGLCLSSSAILTCFGSMYFHWSPNPDSLVWDRIPIVLGFASINALMIADRVDENWGLYSLGTIFILGTLSVIGLNQNWLTLRPYIVVQFGTILFIFLILLFVPAKRIGNSIWWATLSLYVIAKILELADQRILDFTGLISGHSAKHLLAAMAMYKILSAFHNTAQAKSQ